MPSNPFGIKNNCRGYKLKKYVKELFLIIETLFQRFRQQLEEFLSQKSLANCNRFFSSESQEQGQDFLEPMTGSKLFINACPREA